MSKTCIVTGGAGFIGSALSAGLVRRFDRVIAFDSLLAQVHGDTPRPPELDPAVELYRADVREAQAWTALLDTVDAVDTVIDLAAETGTGQSLFSATRHTSVNVVGTSRMMDALAALFQREDPASLTSVDVSIDSHIMALAAERSRLEGGACIDLLQFARRT